MFSGLLKGAIIPTVTVGSMTFMYQQSKLRSSDFLLAEFKPKLSAYRPNDWVHLHYAVQSYQDNGGEVLHKDGWQLIDKHQERMRKGYILEKLQDPEALAVLEQALKGLEEKPIQNAGLIKEVNEHVENIQAKRKGQSKP